jgi:alpha-amylase
LEYNQDEARQILCNWLDKCKAASCAFDFPMKGILQEAVKNCQYYRLADHSGKPSGLLGWWKERAVTFIDNHDTGSTPREVIPSWTLLFLRMD